MEPSNGPLRERSGGRGAGRLHLHVLGSGSKGNCALIEGPEGLIMVDDGLSRREVLARMHALGLDEVDVRALILTHEHSDHIGGIPVWCKRFEGRLYASEGTSAARPRLSDLPFSPFRPGDTLEVAGIRVDSFPTSHDVVNPSGFRFSFAGDAIGYVTDTGILPRLARERLRDARILALESNHDMGMLRTGPYPRHLQDRISSDRGHLSNSQAAEAARELVTERTEHLVAMHISQENNRPSLAVRALAAALGARLDDDLGSTATLEREKGADLHIRAAGQNRPFSCW
ncbi:MAG: MBL fold metallo-hydrolase [Collinsella sp.]|nr:MBL fold metallo-hydrolase [Collinsella sp.]